MSARAPDLAWIDFLQTPDARHALDELADAPVAEDAALGALSALRKRFTPDQAAALLTQARLRRRAAVKFPRAAEMVFAEGALEQATAWPVAAHRAARLHTLAPPGPVLDLGCGLGGDLIALAQHRPVIAWEIDPERAALARANVAALRPPHSVEIHEGDWREALARGSLPMVAAFADPGRRQAGRRLFALESLDPPFSTLLRLRSRNPALAVKGPPGVDLAAVPPECSIEFVSHEGVCKEAVFWFGPLAGPPRWASVHDGGRWHTVEATAARPALGEVLPGLVLYEPDPALLRAGALTPLCEQLNAHLFDPQIGYLVAESYRPTPLAAAFRLREVFPFSLKRLNERLRDLGIGHVEIKKRGFPQEPESLRRRLRLTAGGPPLVIFLTRRSDAHWILLADRLGASVISTGEPGHDSNP